MSVYATSNKELQKRFGTFEYDDSDWALKISKSGKPYLAYIGQETDGRNIVIPKGLKSLDYSFAGTNIEIPPIIPEGITSAKCAFMGCKNLSSAAVLPKSLSPTNAPYLYDRCKKELQDMHYVQTKGKTLVPANMYKGHLGNFAYDPQQFEIQKHDGVDVLKYIGKETDGDKISIPKGCTDLSHTFEGTKIETPPKIPGTVTRIDYMCADCKNLMSAPFIPVSVAGINKNHGFDTQPYTVCKGCAQAVEQAGIDHVNYRGFTAAMYTCAKDVQKQVQALMSKAHSSIENVKNVATEKIYQFEEDLPTYKQAAKDMIKDFKEGAISFSQMASEFTDNVVKNAISSADAIRKECVSNIRSIKSHAIQALDNAKQFTKDTGDKIRQFGKDKIDRFSDFTSTVYANFTKTAGDLKKAAEDKLIAAIAATKQAATKAKDIAVVAKDKAADVIMAGAGAVAYTGSAVGRAAANGAERVATGAKDTADFVKQQAINARDTVKDTVKDVAGHVADTAKDLNEKYNPYKKISVMEERIAQLEKRLADDVPPSKDEIKALVKEQMSKQGSENVLGSMLQKEDKQSIDIEQDEVALD